MGIQTIRIDFPGKSTEHHFRISNAEYRVEQWLNGASHQAKKTQDEKILPIHLILFILAEGIEIEIDDKKIDYFSMRGGYVRHRRVMMVETGGAKYSLILRRIFQEEGWKMESSISLKSQDVFFAIIKGDPVVSLLLERFSAPL